MVAVILTEKPSAAKNFAHALGGMSGNYDGTDYTIVHARGHVFEFVDPHKMVAPQHADSMKKWTLESLPWNVGNLSFTRKQTKGMSKIVSTIKSALSSAQEIIIATDIDPTGEGDLLAWEILDELGFAHGDRAKITRMEFTDEAPSSIQKAFKNRRAVTSMDDEGDLRKATYRAKFDFVSMQWTRLFTIIAQNAGFNTMLRNGRLKSPIVTLVGAQIDAYENYVKKPVYQWRFEDDKGIIYTDPDEEKKDQPDQLVDGKYSDSSVSEIKRENKHTAPPKLLDLAGLSSLLSSRGMASGTVMDTYQKMYEAQVVSYPRTEDKTITNEQFKELRGNMARIAAVVGVDPAVLTHTSPRKTHVKDSGAHGANRPGPNVPASKAQIISTYGDVGWAIYEILAKSALRMFAEDYTYERVTGKVDKYPSFVGSVNIPVSPGWKGIFDIDNVADGDDDGKDGDGKDGGENAEPDGLGSQATPVRHEIINPRPAKPTMRWLMRELEKYNVGTGATRTTTYAEMSNGKPTALLVDTKGAITLTTAGEVNYKLLTDTHIGDLKLTEAVYQHMDEISKGEAQEQLLLAKVADMIVDDIKQVKGNVSAIPEDVRRGLMAETGGSERVSGTYTPTGEEIQFKRMWAKHTFTDDEVATLLAGEDIVIEDAVSARGKPFVAPGRLKKQTFKGDDGKEVEFWGFAPDFSPSALTHHSGVHAPSGKEVTFPKRIWNKQDIPQITDEEAKTLLEGGSIERKGLKAKSGNVYDATFVLLEDPKYGWSVGFPPREINADDYHSGVFAPTGEEISFKKKIWGKDDIDPVTDEEAKVLLAGKTIERKGLTAKSGKTYDAAFQLVHNAKYGWSVGFPDDGRKGGGKKGGGKKGARK